VTSFLPGRRRFSGFLFAFSIRDLKAELLTRRLSLFELMKESEAATASGRGVLRGA
jgi:hypothetical protein